MKLRALDFETWGREPAFALQPCRLRDGSAWLTSYATADQDLTQAGALCPSRETLRQELVRAAAEGVRLVCWNAPFDVGLLLALGLRDEVFACKWLDGLLLYKHCAQEPRYIPEPVVKGWGLKAAVERFWPAEAGYEEGIAFGTEDPEELQRLLGYNKEDCKFTLRLAEFCLWFLSPAQRRAAMVEADCIPLVAEANLNGIVANREKAQDLGDALSETANVAYVTLKVANGDEISREVLASPKQLSDLLYTQWRLPVVKLTEKGATSTDKEALGLLARQDPRAKVIHDYREAHNNRTKFCDATLNSLAYNGDGRVRPAMRVYGTYTGRMTISSKQGKGAAEVPTGVALHQWKREKRFRELVEPPEGYELLEFDFAGQEYKWMAVISGDPVMLRLCQPGEDPHCFMASRIKGDDYKRFLADYLGDPGTFKEPRQLGKVANLSLQYRTGWQTLMLLAWRDYGVVLTDAEAKAIHGTYRTTYLEVPAYWQRQIYTGRNQGWVETLAGRRIQLGLSEAWSPETKWARESSAINFPIQGVGADQKYLALKVLRDYLPRVDGRFYFELHDGLFVVVPKDKADRAVPEIKWLLSNLPYKRAWGRSFPIQFPVDAKRGSSWGALKDAA